MCNKMVICWYSTCFEIFQIGLTVWTILWIIYSTKELPGHTYIKTRPTDDTQFGKCLSKCFVMQEYCESLIWQKWC